MPSPKTQYNRGLRINSTDESFTLDLKKVGRKNKIDRIRYSDRGTKSTKNLRRRKSPYRPYTQVSDEDEEESELETGISKSTMD